MHQHSKSQETLRHHYAALLSQHGDSPQAVQFRDRPTQEARMHILSQVGDLQGTKILDFGCGTAHFFEFLNERNLEVEYVGIDLVPEMLEIAKTKFPGNRFYELDICAQGLGEDFDFIFVNGVFNNKVEDNVIWMRDILKNLFKSTRKSLAFNALSSYVDYEDEGLFYYNPEDVFGFCKTQLSRRVTLRHDYLVKPGILPFEFTVYVYK